MRVDIHQHLFTEPVLAALARRDEAPRLVRRDRSWALELAGEPGPPSRRPGRRSSAACASCTPTGSTGRCCAPRSPLGVEALAPRRGPRDPRRLPARARPSCPSASRRGARSREPRPRPRGGRELLRRGAVGLALPARRARRPRPARPAALRSRRSSAPTRPCWSTPARGCRRPTRPPWWPAMTSYVAELHAAWHAFAAFGRPEPPAPARRVRAAGRRRAAPRRAPGRPRRPGRPRTTR